MKKKTYNDEIDISDLIISLWDNKIKILIITSIFLILGFINYSIIDKSYIATTNIKPISIFETKKYDKYNTLIEEFSSKDLRKKTSIIDQNQLLKLFINKVRTVNIIERAIIKNNLINKDNFTSKKSYKDAINRKALSIRDQISNENNKNWQLNFRIKDKQIWSNFLKDIEKLANEKTRQALITEFNRFIDILNTKNKFKLEDINQKIANAFEDYETSTSIRLAFLKEQAEIARTLNLAKNTLLIEKFETNNTVVTNIKSENSYYLKGYEMIEKEISIINSRSNESKNLFIKNLFELEKTKRSILQNKVDERLKLYFLNTPIPNKSEFIAAKIDFIVTDFKSEQSLKKMLSISILIGLLISIIYVFLFNVISQRK